MEIAIDNLNKFGWFIEVEYLCDFRDVKKARKEVTKIIKKLGFKKQDLEEKGYTKMLWDKRN